MLLIAISTDLFDIVSLKKRGKVIGHVLSKLTLWWMMLPH